MRDWRREDKIWRLITWRRKRGHSSVEIRMEKSNGHFENSFLSANQILWREQTRTEREW